ncbi:MAG: DNA-binding protein [Alphaproteobacteria bacterium]|nr:DNA-binding protein [Alphaproteobacteria bacterium]
MKRSFFLALLLAAAPLSVSAQTTHPKPTPEDLRPNDPKVPDAYAISGHITRIVVMRMKYQTDLLHGMEKLVKEQNIRNGVILSGIGSLRGYKVHSVSSRDLPPSDTFVANPKAPANLNGMNGYIVDGAIHAHVTMALDGGSRTVSGHLEPGCEVLTYAIVTVGILDVPLGKVQEQNYR